MVKKLSTASYHYVIMNIAGRDVLVIYDNNDTIGRSVINDIENVVMDISKEADIDPFDYLIVYRDSEGVFDGYDPRTFQFVALYEVDLMKAIQKYILKQINLN
jgi:hypothetical protein